MRNRLIHLYPFTVLLLGMIVTQVLATVQVYLSNTDLYNGLMAIKDAGYLTIPNKNVIGSLKSFGPAFCGGLFFAFSIGAGISFLSLALAWIWDRIFYRKTFLLYLFILLWVGCLTALNLNGFKLFVTLYFLLIPPVVCITAAKSMSDLNEGSGSFCIPSLSFPRRRESRNILLKKLTARPRLLEGPALRGHDGKNPTTPDLNKQKRRFNEILHMIPVIVLALLLALQIDSRMFTDFRDIYLLSNPVGSRINKFYYKYTLYPAEVFKSLNQKMIKTVVIESRTNTVTRTLENILLNNDYLPINSDFDADLRIAAIEDDFIFKNHDRVVLQISFQKFFSDPRRAVMEFEQKSDAWALFRQITFLCLLTGFPLAVYVIVRGGISILFGFFFNLRTASATASAICFVLCLIFLFSFQLNRGRNISEKNLADALNSGRWQDRVAALKFIDENGLEIKKFQAYPGLLKSPYIAERYWFVRTLAHSRDPETYRALLSFLDDTHPNVFSMALYALGKRGDKRAIERIMPLIETSEDWYHQWYAYRALRTLGWRQTKLN